MAGRRDARRADGSSSGRSTLSPAFEARYARAVTSPGRALLLLALVFLGLALPARGQDGAAGAPPGAATLRCEIAGVVSALRVRTRERPRRFVVLDGVAAVVSPLRRGLSAVRATLADGSRVEATTREDVAIEVGAAVALAGGALTARVGARVTDIVAVAGTADAEIDVALAPGVVARGVTAPCATLRPAPPGAGVAEPLAVPPSLADRALPRWRPRVRDLHLRSGDDPDRGQDLHLDVTDAGLVLVETERHRGWARVAAALPGGEVRGWTRDTDLAPALRD